MGDDAGLKRIYRPDYRDPIVKPDEPELNPADIEEDLRRVQNQDETMTIVNWNNLRDTPITTILALFDALGYNRYVREVSIGIIFGLKNSVQFQFSKYTSERQCGSVNNKVSWGKLSAREAKCRIQFYFCQANARISSPILPKQNALRTENRQPAQQVSSEQEILYKKKNKVRRNNGKSILRLVTQRRRSRHEIRLFVEMPRPKIAFTAYSYEEFRQKYKAEAPKQLLICSAKTVDIHRDSLSFSFFIYLRVCPSIFFFLRSLTMKNQIFWAFVVSEKRIVFSPKSPNKAPVLKKTKTSLESWTHKIFNYCLHNSILWISDWNFQSFWNILVKK